MFGRVPLLMLTLASMASFFGLQDCNPGDDDGTPDTTAVPTPIPEGMCRNDNDCTQAQICLAPGEFAGCGICYLPENTCSSPSDCTDGYVCAPDTSPCLCAPADVCQASCQTTGCSDGERCGSSGLCETISCTEGTFSCPTLTTCTAGAPGDGCVRWSCSTDVQCGEGNACVEGHCYETYGTCSYLPARPGL